MRSEEVVLIALILLFAAMAAPLAASSVPITLAATPVTAPPTLELENTFGAGTNPTGSPIGGGEYYSNIVTAADPRLDYIVTNTDELLTALRDAKDGDWIYIDGNAQLNLTDVPIVTIPAGVTIASNRGETNTAGRATYQVTVEEPGEYTLWGVTLAPDDDHNSFWVRVDGEECRQWDLEPGQDWRWNREGTHNLSAGQHTLIIQWREDGPVFDGILITGEQSYVPGATTDAGELSGGKHFWIEAESGVLSPPMETGKSPTASGRTYITVPEGSGMGDPPVSPGGGIFLGPREHRYQVALIAGGENVTITGLRIEGPDMTTEVVDYPNYGIYSPYRHLEVENCELSGWSGAAVTVYQTAGADMRTGGYIHHNHIHHCQMADLGYGVVVSEGAVCLVEANYFDYCRHAIAGTGEEHDGYEARYNIVGSHFTAGYAHNFDMHGKPDPSGNGTIAGDVIRIHHNTFLCTQPSSSFPIFIQGVPRVEAYIDHNWFYYTQSAPVWQSSGNGNISMIDNIIGPEKEFQAQGPIRILT